MIRPSFLVAQLVCPRCAIRVGGFDPEVFRGLQQCFKRRCEQNWWAMRLLRGEIGPQLDPIFGHEFAHVLCQTWSLPEVTPQPIYWQVSLSRRQAEQVRSSGSVPFLKRATALHQLGGALVSATQQTYRAGQQHSPHHNSTSGIAPSTATPAAGGAFVFRGR